MTDSAQQPDERNVMADFRELCRDGSRLITLASKAQKRKLFTALQELFPSKESMLNFSLQLLLNSKGVARYIEEAPQAQRKNLVTVLEDLRANDRRRHARKPSSIQITVDRVHTAVAKNISASGIFVHTPVPFSDGQQIELDFAVPGAEEPVKMTGEVIWTSRLGVGVRFTSPLSGELRNIIEPS